jgi:hypothetical protein
MTLSETTALHSQETEMVKKCFRNANSQTQKKLDSLFINIVAMQFDFTSLNSRNRLFWLVAM